MQLNNCKRVKQGHTSPLCPLCSTTSKPYETGDGSIVEDFSDRIAEYYSCDICHVLFQDPPFVVSELPPELIEAEIANQNPIGSGKITDIIYSFYYRFTRHNVLQFKGRSAARLLDVGCGTGQFCALASNFFETWGIDTSDEACNVAKSKGLTTIICGQFGEHQFEHSYNILTFWQTIEHLEISPVEALKAAYDILEPGGILHLGEVPNRDGLEFHYFNGRCFYFASPVHNYIFSEDFFLKALPKIGFQNVKIQHDWKNYTLLSGSLFIKLQDRFSIHLNATKRLFLSILLYPFLLPANILISVLRKSATFSVTATKPHVRG